MNILFVTLDPGVLVLPTVAFFCSLNIELFIAKFVSCCCLLSPNVFALPVLGFAPAIEAATLVFFTSVTIHFVDIWWTLTGIARALFRDVAVIHSISAHNSHVLHLAVIAAESVATIGAFSQGAVLTAVRPFLVTLLLTATVTLLSMLHEAIATFWRVQQLQRFVEQTCSATAVQKIVVLLHIAVRELLG